MVGTKTEMERLIKDANRVKEANGEMADLSIDSFADVTEAIHIIQTEMGITGTTAKEAETTITGSLNMVKASWENLLVGMADKNANMAELINQLVESVSTFAGNLLPVVEQALLGIGTLIETLLPQIVDRIPIIINEVLPQLLNSGMQIVTTLINRYYSKSTFIDTNSDSNYNSICKFIDTNASNINSSRCRSYNNNSRNINR